MEGDGEDDVPWSKAKDDGESGNESDTDVDEFSNHESSAEVCHLVLYFN
jgi:hypothetical protein